LDPVFAGIGSFFSAGSGIVMGNLDESPFHLETVDHAVYDSPVEIAGVGIGTGYLRLALIDLRKIVVPDSLVIIAIDNLTVN